jgi:hypothetical protein
MTHQIHYNSESHYSKHCLHPGQSDPKDLETEPFAECGVGIRVGYTITISTVSYKNTYE